MPGPENWPARYIQEKLGKLGVEFPAGKSKKFYLDLYLNNLEGSSEPPATPIVPKPSPVKKPAPKVIATGKGSTEPPAAKTLTDEELVKAVKRVGGFISAGMRKTEKEKVYNTLVVDEWRKYNSNTVSTPRTPRRMSTPTPKVCNCFLVYVNPLHLPPPPLLRFYMIMLSIILLFILIVGGKELVDSFPPFYRFSCCSFNSLT